MYRDLKADIDDGYIVTNKGDLQTVRDGDFIVQHLKQRFQTFQGESFFNTVIGIPYLTEFFEKSASFSRMSYFLKKEIRAVPGVRKILNFTMTKDARLRRLYVTFKVDTVFGPISFTEEVQI